MTLWSIFRSPLIFGGELPPNDAATTALLTNQEVIDVNQHSSSGHEVLERGNLRVWTADGPIPAERYVAVFNVGDTAQDVNLGWNELGIQSRTKEVLNLWTHQPEAVDSVQTHIRPHASALYRVTSN
jgi:alpha-galactosidase